MLKWRAYVREGCQNKKLQPLIEGAPNFRQVSWFFSGCETTELASVSQNQLTTRTQGYRCRTYQYMEWRYLLSQAYSMFCNSWEQSTVSHACSVLLHSVLQTDWSKLPLYAGHRKVLWHNMREEPVLYINGKPYVVREANKPFANLEYTGKNETL